MRYHKVLLAGAAALSVLSASVASTNAQTPAKPLLPTLQERAMCAKQAASYYTNHPQRRYESHYNPSLQRCLVLETKRVKYPDDWKDPKRRGLHEFSQKLYDAFERRTFGEFSLICDRDDPMECPYLKNYPYKVECWTADPTTGFVDELECKQFSDFTRFVSQYMEDDGRAQ